MLKLLSYKFFNSQRISRQAGRFPKYYNTTTRNENDLLASLQGN